jgi:hypothetical protein
MVYRQTGNTVTNQINVIFPRYNKDGQENPVQLRNVEFNLLPVDDLSIFRDNYSVFIGTTQTILVCGEIDLDYSGGWVTTAVLTTWENQNFTTGANRVAEGRRPADVNFNWFGDKRLHHIIAR